MYKRQHQGPDVKLLSEWSVNKLLSKSRKSRKLVPVIKFKSEVAKLLFENELILPFNARCTPTQLPANNARPIAVIEKSLIENLSQVETTTAITVMNAAITRRFVINDLAPPLKPNLSTHKEIPVCPARDASVGDLDHPNFGANALLRHPM